jgi:diguanylate cyclase (GGDEF)-like protein
MSLFKQIQMLVALLLSIMLVIVLKINFDNAREFSANQLFNTGKNVANVLALSLGPQISDQALMETNVNAMFDGGLFQEIAIARQDGTAVYRRSQKVVIDGVPSIFIRYVQLQQPFVEAQISEGWSIFGTVRVKGHPGPFYISLWEMFKRLCILFVFLGGVAITASYFILRLLLQSLQKIQRQAEAISNNVFVVNETVPRTPELKKVVVAMNTMVVKVQQIFNRQLDNIKHYQEMQFKDELTGLYNRAFLVKQLSHFLDGDSEKANGQVLMFGLGGMENIRIATGHPKIQGFYQNLAAILRQEIARIPDSVTARLPQHDFAAILPNCSLSQSVTIADAIIAELQVLIAGEPVFAEGITVNGGVAPYHHQDSVGKVLSKADYALSTAKSGLPGRVDVYKVESGQTVLGKFEWKTLIEDGLAQRRFFLTAQPVIAEAGEYHREIYVNHKDPHGSIQKAGYFMPMAINLGLAGKVDRFVLENAALQLEGSPESVFAVNITSEFCKDRLSFTWLRKFLSANNSIKKRLVFEIHENTLLQHPLICIDLAGMLKGLGYGFGIDHYSMNEASLDMLKEMNPSYIKVEKDYFLESDSPGNTRMAINALLTITESLGIIVIATMIENEEQRMALAANNITHFQGYGIAGIAPLEG